jgi:plasmid stabilization system protein ParE
MKKALEILYTETFKADVKVAINWKSRSQSTDQARDLIKVLLQDFDNQIRLFPGSGKKIDLIAMSDSYSEMIKGDYRFVYKTDKDQSGGVCIYVLMFCHQRMDFETLVRQRTLAKYI